MKLHTTFPGTRKKEVKAPKNQETVKQFLARGGKISKHAQGETGYNPTYYGLSEKQKINKKAERGES